MALNATGATALGAVQHPGPRASPGSSTPGGVVSTHPRYQIRWVALNQFRLRLRRFLHLRQCRNHFVVEDRRR